MTKQQDDFWNLLYPRVSYNVELYGWSENLIAGIIAQAGGESGYGTNTISQYYNYWGMTDGWTDADYYVTVNNRGWCAFNSMNNGIDFYFRKLENSRIYSDAKNQTDPYDYVRYLSEQGWNEEGVEQYMKLMTPIIEYYSGKEPPTPPTPPEPEPTPTPPKPLPTSPSKLPLWAYTLRRRQIWL